MNQITLSNGFIAEIEDDALDDAELLEALVHMQDNEAYGIEALERFLGKKQKKKLYEHIRGENGRVKASDAIVCLTEIMKGFDEGKNS